MFFSFLSFSVLWMLMLMNSLSLDMALNFYVKFGK